MFNFIRKRIEVVITGLTRNQLYLTVPWVRIPPLPPMQKATQSGGFLHWRSMQWDSKQHKNNTVRCFCAVTEEFCKAYPKMQSAMRCKIQEESHRFCQKELKLQDFNFFVEIFTRL